MAGKKGLSGRKPGPKVTAPEGRPTKAEWLDAVASEFWENAVVLLESMPGQLSTVDESVLNDYAFTHSLIMQCKEKIEKLGTTTVSGNGSLCSSPHMTQMLQLMKQKASYEKQLGLTPAARKQLGMKTEEPKSNKFAHLLGGTRPTLKMEAS